MNQEAGDRAWPAHVLVELERWDRAVVHAVADYHLIPHGAHGPIRSITICTNRTIACPTGPIRPITICENRTMACPTGPIRSITICGNRTMACPTGPIRSITICENPDHRMSHRARPHTVNDHLRRGLGLTYPSYPDYLPTTTSSRTQTHGTLAERRLVSPLNRPYLVHCRSHSVASFHPGTNTRCSVRGRCRDMTSISGRPSLVPLPRQV